MIIINSCACAVRFHYSLASNRDHYFIWKLYYSRGSNDHWLIQRSRDSKNIVILTQSDNSSASYMGGSAFSSPAISRAEFSLGEDRALAALVA